MYHPTRGGVRGGRDQFSWDDVKVDKHRENYLGHSIKAPVGRWQKGGHERRDKKNQGGRGAGNEEALGLAPKRAAKSQGNRLDKHEFAELVKRGSTAEDLGAGHAEAAEVHGLGFARGSRSLEESNLPSGLKTESVENMNANMPTSSARNDEEESDDESSRKKRKREEKKRTRRKTREAAFSRFR
ncbi:hypothetical protein DH2020_021049 [Rehmannia glutinosa]|uniref:Multiple myeloma tumor-associated protein 2-like N-terminal domain-containing protein n=1 Tax=Rehmannia glutinosa TaxID=99300 RepID=A0ABR0WDR9_REHGL